MNYETELNAYRKRFAFAMTAYACVFALFVLSLFLPTCGHSAELKPPTRVTDYDWQCQKEDGTKISNHTRNEIAFVTCLNHPQGSFIQGGKYRVNRTEQAIVPPIVPVPIAGSAVVSWIAPRGNTDGTPLVDLAGYTLAYGPAPDRLETSVSLSAVAISYRIEGLASGTWFFSIKAKNSSGTESAAVVVSKTII